MHACMQEDDAATDEDLVKLIVGQNKKFRKSLVDLKGDAPALTMDMVDAKGSKLSKGLKRFFLSMAMAEEI